MTKTITITCEDCKGEGFIPTTELFHGKRVQTAIPCQGCRQTGRISFEFEVCEHCGEPTCCGECVPTQEPATAPVVYAGGIVEAPGFTSATFAAGVAKAQKVGYLNMRPMRNGSIRVDSGKAGSVYQVTRDHCGCAAGRSHGYCYHRAAVIFVHDVCGIDVTREEILGFDLDGSAVTAADRAAQLQEVA